MGVAQRSRGQIEHTDVRRLWLRRSGVAVASAALATFALWTAGVKLPDWWVSGEKWPQTKHQSPPPIVPKRRVVVPAHGDLPLGRIGTDASASQNPVRLVLVRTVPGPNVHTGQAMLGTVPEHPQVFLGGATLENGARIDEIYRDHIVLVKGLQRVALYVEGMDGAADPSKHAAGLLTVGGSPPPPAVGVRHPSGESITDYLRPVPKYNNGVVAGFEVYPGARSSLFDQWGLKSGDMVTAIDGQPLMDSDQAMALFGALTKGEAITATVHRDGGGEPVEVVLDGADIERMQSARNAPPVSMAHP